MIRQELERQLCRGAIEFASLQYQQARMSGSIDAQLQAAELLFTAAQQAHMMLAGMPAPTVNVEVNY